MSFLTLQNMQKIVNIFISLPFQIFIQIVKLSKYLTYLEVISHSNSLFLGSPGRLLFPWGELFRPWAFIFLNPFCYSTKFHADLSFHYYKESYKAFCHPLNFLQELRIYYVLFQFFFSKQRPAPTAPIHLFLSLLWGNAYNKSEYPM